MIYGHGKVGRSVQISHCFGQRIIVNANDPPDFVDFSIDIFGCYTPERATRFARRVMSDKTIMINNVEIETRFYSMELSKFIQLAERTNNNGN